MITEMTKLEVYLANVQETVKGRDEEKTYFLFYSPEGRKPVLVGNPTPEGFVISEPTAKLRDTFLRKVGGEKELPQVGKTPVTVVEVEVDEAVSV